MREQPSPTASSHLEKIPVVVHASSHAASAAVAREIADLIHSRQGQGKRAVLGLATGSTPHGVYEELVRLHKDFFDFSQAKAGGEDLRVESSSGVPLAYQVEEWNPA